MFKQKQQNKIAQCWLIHKSINKSKQETTKRKNTEKNGVKGCVGGLLGVRERADWLLTDKSEFWIKWRTLSISRATLLCTGSTAAALELRLAGTFDFLFFVFGGFFLLSEACAADPPPVFVPEEKEEVSGSGRAKSAWIDCWNEEIKKKQGQMTKKDDKGHQQLQPQFMCDYVSLAVFVCACVNNLLCLSSVLSVYKRWEKKDRGDGEEES